MPNTATVAAVVYARMCELLPPEDMARLTVDDVERLLLG